MKENTILLSATDNKQTVIPYKIRKQSWFFDFWIGDASLFI